MNVTLRRIAVSGSAAVALLGGAAAITTATAPSASAAEMQTSITRTTGAPVSLPDGRVVHVRGMDAAAYTASPEQHSVIVQAAANATPDPAGISNGLTADGGQGAPITNPQTPVTGVQTGYNQQITTQSAGGYIAAGVVGTLLFGAIAIIRLRSNAHKGDAVLFLFLGVGLGGTAFGTMIHQMTTSGVGSLGSIFGSL
ncbi:hypothetical protein [Streptomyces mirabilis]|uniref:hypothetical protein n=1 Tax=Streptomyces mirabilis TaxID=68239 RepID=UPI003668F7B3